MPCAASSTASQPPKTSPIRPSSAAASRAPRDDGGANGGTSHAELAIAHWPDGVLGDLRTPDPKQCAAGRPISVYEQKGSKPNPDEDRLIEKVAAYKAGKYDSYVWTAEAGTDGQVYAETEPRPGCADVRSDTISMALAQSEAVPACPQGGLGPGGTPAFCKFDMKYNITACSAYARDTPLYPCYGSALGNSGWAVPVVSIPGSYAGFAWLPAPGGKRHISAFTVVFLATAGIDGLSDGPNRAEFEVTRAYNNTYNPGAKWITPPHSTGTPGLMGGPLYLNFDGGAVGATVYIYGFLLRVD